MRVAESQVEGLALPLAALTPTSFSFFSNPVETPTIMLFARVLYRP